MLDAISLTRIEKLHPKIREEVKALVEQANEALTGRAKVRIVQGYRTFAEQDALYKQRPKVTNAKGGQSYHNYGLAIDFALLIDGKTISWDTAKDYDGDGQSDWLEVVLIFTKSGYKWGKAFNDLPHLEKTFGKNWRDYLAQHNAGQVDKDGYVLIP